MVDWPKEPDEDKETDLEDGEDLSDTEADVVEFAKEAGSDDDLSDTEADVGKLQENDQSE
jgi:hypothetical protein